MSLEYLHEIFCFFKCNFKIAKQVIAAQANVLV